MSDYASHPRNEKMKNKLAIMVIFPVLLIPIACVAIYIFADVEEIAAEQKALEAEPFDPSSEFKSYWYAGDAELTSYKLDQARYGEMHEGTAMLMFVAEDFSTKELTKSDGTNGPKMPVLKVNFEKKFITGIYPYSLLMTAVSPLDFDRHPLPLTVATSCQEWCGHTFTQLNFKGGKFGMTEHSYFPGEGDRSKTLDGVIPEDAIWTRLRIAPDKLPTGTFMMIPGTMYARLRHQPLDPVKVNASHMPGDTAGVKIYQIAYASGARQLKIWYDDKFPYGIRAWEEDYEEGFGPSARHWTTKATRMVTKKLDYWNNHKNIDRVLRTEMGL
jgi:hypothetical protein